MKKRIVFSAGILLLYLAVAGNVGAQAMEPPEEMSTDSGDTGENATDAAATDAGEADSDARPLPELATEKSPGNAVDASPDARTSRKKTLDPVLLDIERQLQRLVTAQLPGEADVQLLFDVPLDEVDRVAARIEQLKQERGTLRSSREDREKRLKTLTTEYPEPEKPASLDTPPESPTPPTAPPAPEKPQAKRPNGKLTPKRTTAWQEAYHVWQAYDEALARHQLEMETYAQQQAEYDAAMVRYESERNAFLAQRTAWENARVAHGQKLARMAAELKLDLETIGLRGRILNLRLKYLDALHGWLQPLTAPARTAFQGLKMTRKPLVDTIEQTEQLRDSLGALADRIEVVANRAEAGSMVGFHIKLAQLAADLRLIADSVQQRERKIQSERRTLKELRIDLRRQSGDVRRLVLANVFHPKRDTLVDAAFLSHLSDMRKAAKSWFLKDIDLKRSEYLRREIGEIAPEPQHVAEWSDGAAILTRIKPILEKLDVQLDELNLFREHQKQVFRREAVSVLSNLATDKTRRMAYSVSQEILSDISSDAHTLADTLVRWMNGRKAAIARIPDMVRERKGIVFLVRVLAAISLLILIGFLGRQLSRLISLGIRRFSTSRFFRYRLGQLVKWAGVVEAILPTVVVGAALYAALAIVGFSVPEVKFTEVILRWLIIYRFGGRLLEGLTKRVSRGRPAFIPVRPAVADMLSGTYRKLGLVVALAAVVLEWTADWFGSGILHTLIVYTLWGWLCFWGVWVLFVWRPVVATSLASRYATNGDRATLKSAIGKVAAWMNAHRAGAIFTAPAVLLLFADWFYRLVRFLLYEGGIVTFFRARLIRRLVNTRKRNSNMPGPRTLPEAYTRAFPLYPIYDEENAVILPRQKSVENIVQQIDRWKRTRQDSSLVLLGEKGVGKTTLLTLLEHQLSGNVLRYSISQKLKTEKALVTEFAGMLDIGECPPVVGSIASHLNRGEERIILIDEGHNVFLRTIDGYEAYESLIRLVNVTSQNVFWVLVFNTFSFAFLNASRNRLHYFRKLHYLPTWTRDELFDLISRRNRQTGFDVEFDEVLLDANRSSTGDFEVIEGAEGFFRLLWENSGGNPRVATCLWLDALTSLGENRIRVGIFSETLATDISKMDAELLYALAAICQHENLSVAELRDALNVSVDFANFAIRFLTEYGLVEPKHTDARRHTLAPRFYPQVLKLLRGHHLLYEKE